MNEIKHMMPVYVKDSQLRVGFGEKGNNDPALVKQDQSGSWKPVEVSDINSVSFDRNTLADNHGLMTGDKVKPLGLHHVGPTSFREIGKTAFFVGAEIIGAFPMGPVAVPCLQVITLPYGSRSIRDNMKSAYNKAINIRNDDNKWNLPVK